MRSPVSWAASPPRRPPKSRRESSLGGSPGYGLDFGLMADSCTLHTLSTGRTKMSLRVTTVAVIVSILMWSQSPATADELRLAQASGTEKAPGAPEKGPGRAEGRA